MYHTFPHHIAVAGLLLVGLAVVATIESKSAEAQDASFQLNVFGATKEVTLEDLGVTLVKKNDVGLLEVISGKRYDLVWDSASSDSALRTLWEVPMPDDAHFVYENGVLSIQPEVLGAEVNVNQFLNQVESDYPSLENYSLESTSAELITQEELAPYTNQVNTLLTRGLLLTVDGEPQTFQMQIKDLEFTKRDGVVQFQLGEPYIDYVTTTLSGMVYIEPSHLRILEANPDVVDYVVSEGTLSNGRQLLIPETETLIQSTVASGGIDIAATVEVLSAQIINETEHDLGTFEFLGQGHSLFERSAWGRAHNIEKGLNDHFNGLLIPPGAEFFFNDFLGPINGSEGWADSYVIWHGELERRLGGGICQVSTTVYRGALDLGLDITDQRTHSLYVLYYQEFGDGLDATVYPGEQNLVFVNNTPGYLFMHSYTTADDHAYVDFYGVNDGRSTTLEGPYTANTQTDEVISALGGDPLEYYEIAWKYVITWGDGTVEERWIKSSYKGKVKQDHPVTVM